MIFMSWFLGFFFKILFFFFLTLGYVMVFGLGFWFSFSLLGVFFLLALNSNRYGGLRAPFSASFFLAGGILFFFWVYFDHLFYFFSGNTLGDALGLGFSYV